MSRLRLQLLLWQITIFGLLNVFGLKSRVTVPGLIPLTHEGPVLFVVRFEVRIGSVQPGTPFLLEPLPLLLLCSGLLGQPVRDLLVF